MDINELLGVDFSNPLTLTAYIISTVGLIVFTLSGALKRKNMLIGAQTVSNVLLGISDTLIYAWAGLAQDIINFLRNIFVLKNWINKKTSILFIILSFVVGLLVFLLAFDTSDLLKSWGGLLPMIATVEYSVVVILPKSGVASIKLSLIVSSLCWCFYGIIIKMYTITFFNGLAIILAVVTLIIYFYKKRKKNEENRNKECSEGNRTI